MRPVRLIDYFNQYDSTSAHHIAAVHELERQMPEELLDRWADWAVIFREATQELK